MALSALRLRRPLCFALARAIAAAPTTAPRCAPSFSGPVTASSELGRVPAPLWIVPSASFRSTAVAALPSSPSYGDDDKIPPDAILFEGCDYNHWLITMDFPKDPSPTKEEMVQAYVDTCAKGLGCSVEEAMKKMYACSTTTYVGFQAVMTEEESEKFRGLPGVVFILPDSYIDPINKEYGGDKYINGTIIPRPPPQTYSRGGPRRERPRRDYSTPHNVSSDDYQYASSRDGRGFTPQQNNGPPGQNDGREFGQPRQNDGRGFVPPAQNDSRFGPSGKNEGSRYVQPGQGDGRSYDQTGVNDGRGMGPPGQFDGRWNVPAGDWRGSPTQGPMSPPGERGDYGRGESRGPMSPPGYQGGDWRGSPTQGYQGGDWRGSPTQGDQGGDWRGSPTQGPPSYNQGERGNFNLEGHQAFSGNNRGMNSPPGGDSRQGGPKYNQNYAAPGQGQRFDRDFQQNGPPGYGQNYGRPSESPQFNEQ